MLCIINILLCVELWLQSEQKKTLDEAIAGGLQTICRPSLAQIKHLANSLELPENQVKVVNALDVIIYNGVGSPFRQLSFRNPIQYKP